MAVHLSEQRLTDVLDGVGAPADRAHAAACRECSARLEDARAALELAAEADVPEPPSPYWESLRRNVSRRIAEEPRQAGPFRWLVPLATAAALIVALSVTRSPESTPSVPPTLPAWSALPPADEDEGLELLGGMAVVGGDIVAGDEGRGLGAFVAGLSDEETEVLVEALRATRAEAEL